MPSRTEPFVHVRGALAVAAVVAMLALVDRALIGGTEPNAAAQTPVEPAVGPVLPQARFSPAFTTAPMSFAAEELSAIDEDLARRLLAGDVDRVRDRLLGLAADAVSGHRVDVLADVLSVLGRLAVHEQDYDTAEVYFHEALESFRDTGDRLGEAAVQLHLGAMHLKLRERARIAGQAYDRTLLARWQFVHGHYAPARENLLVAVEENLAVHRFGAAADAYRTLVRVHAASGRLDLAEEAAMEAVRLYADSGQIDEARVLLDEMARVGASTGALAATRAEVETRYAAYQHSVTQVARARDYDQLYNQFRAQGDQAAAWRLRLKANRSLGNVPQRAMFRRTPDVIAVLYTSITDVERAMSYLSQAEEAFATAGRSDLLDRAASLREQIH